MKNLSTLITTAALLTLSGGAAFAVNIAGTPAGAASGVVSGVALASLCDGCGVVSNAHTETRKGEGSGLGAVGGAVVGGVLGHQIGGGSGKKATTVLGAVAGGVAGHAIEKNMKKHEVWVTTVTFRDGTKKTYEAGSDPGLKSGDIVKVDSGHPMKKAP